MLAEWLSRSGQQLRDEGASGGDNLPAILLHQERHHSPRDHSPLQQKQWTLGAKNRKQSKKEKYRRLPRLPAR